MPRKLGYVALAVLLLLVGVSVTRWSQTPPSAPPTVSIAPEGADASDAETSTGVLRAPPSALVELAVATKHAAEPIDRAALAAQIAPAVCGDEAACDAVRATLRDEHATTLRAATPDEWRLDAAPDAEGAAVARWPTLWVVRVATAPSPRNLAIRTAFAVAATLAAQLDGVVVDRLLGRAESAKAFAAHAVTEGIDAPIFRADRVRVTALRAGEGTVRLRTAGLARWGAPDVEAVAVPVAAEKALTDVVLGVAAALAGGRRSGPVTLSRAELEAAAGRPPGDGGVAGDEEGRAPVRLDLASAVADRDEGSPPDGSDFLARIEPAGGDGPLAYLELGEAFFGPLLAIPDDDASVRAEESRAAGALAAALDGAGGPASGKRVLVRLPFDIPGGGHELLWVEVTSHDARTITGRIADEPLAATDVEHGQVVTRPRGEVEDVRVR